MMVLLAAPTFGQELSILLRPNVIYVEELGGQIVPVNRVFFHVIFHNVSAHPIEIQWIRFDLVGRSGEVVSGQFSGSALITLFDNAMERRRIEPTPSGTLVLQADERKALSDVFLNLPASMMGQTLIVESEFTTGERSSVNKISMPILYSGGFVGRLPFEGTWYVAGEHGFLDSHKRFVPETFAYDFLVIGSGGKSYEGTGSRNVDYYAYRRPVLASKGGEVVYMRNNIPENVPGRSMPATPGGNAIVIRHDDGKYTYYAHMTPSGMKVGLGDTVSAGDVIGEVGNSGDSSEPHLHFHAMSGPDPGQSSGIPILFENWISDAYGREAVSRRLGTISKGTFVQP